MAAVDAIDGMRATARAMYDAAVAAVEPRAAVAAALTRAGDRLAFAGEHIDLRAIGRVVLIGAGKASAPMAQAVEDVLGEVVADGVVIVKYGHGAPCRRCRIHEAAHPVPDTAGEDGARAIERAVAGLGPRDLVVACWSGGASALMPAPRHGVTLADKQATTRLLLASGATIAEINAVRKHLSRLKGGQLAALIQPARMLVLALSDVIGDDPSVIGSGPFTPDGTTYADVAAIVAARGIAEALPAAVRDLIARGVRGEEGETAKPGDACFQRVRYAIVGSNALALDAAAARARAVGLTPRVEAEPILGEARDAAQRFVERARALPRGACLIAGGETTVTLGTTPGLGGRAQEFALAAALAGAGSDLVVLAAGTDGNDGPTDAAGGMVDATTVARAGALGFDARRHLAGHDANPLLAACGDLVVTGPTRTNVMDVHIALRA
ncbi:MAG TPA: DUF4147 domain-containing protein [Planctomycetota bacterium]|nr:DUF4147 domain-containing protein [Planctomycetota bacterium]